jgi:phosphopentomutase
MSKKVLAIVLDGVGVGELPDAVDYGDVGRNTVGNLSKRLGSLHLPNLEKLGLGYLTDINGVARIEHPIGFFGKMAERSAGKDSTTGHWELAGIVTETPFPLYPDGFPDDVVKKFCDLVGVEKIFCNKPASGTEVIERFGKEHLATGCPIVYTSGDSVFQIAAHTSIMPLERLYEMCEIARTKVLIGKHEVGRVIARPFTGTPGHFVRTTDRKDYAVRPNGKLLSEALHEAGVETTAIGKIDDLYSGIGFETKLHPKGNTESIETIIAESRKRKALTKDCFIMANLVDFDMLYGHRNDAVGFAAALKEFDGKLPEIVETLSEEDLLLLTADHGNDPTKPGTDHTREYVPILAFTKANQAGKSLGTRGSFADMAATIAAFYGIDFHPAQGTSFFKDIFTNAEVAG